MEKEDVILLNAARKLIKKDPKNAFISLTQLKEGGSVWASIYLAHMYEFGLGLEASKMNAEICLREAYDAGLAEGLYRLGRFYYKYMSYDQAEKAFLEGVNRGYPSSMYWLARTYQKKPHTDRHKNKS